MLLSAQPAALSTAPGSVGVEPAHACEAQTCQAGAGTAGKDPPPQHQPRRALRMVPGLSRKIDSLETHSDSGSGDAAPLLFIDTAIAFGNGPAEPALNRRMP